MRFRARLQILGLPLILAPALVSMLVFSVSAYRSGLAAEREILSARLGLLRGRLEVAYETLYKLGLQGSPFFTANTVDPILESFAEESGGRRGILVLDGEGGPVGASPGVEPRPAEPGDPLREVLGMPGHGDEAFATVRSPALGGHPSLVGHAHLEGWPWVLVAFSDLGALFAGLTGTIAVAGLASVLIALGGAVLFLLFSNRVSRPLAALAGIAKGMGEGRLGLRAEVGGIDEIRLLARSFNEMAAGLEGLTKELEARVEARTAELSAANARLESLNAELRESLAREERMRGMLVQTEKFAALGQLVAGIAHELNSPLGAIASSAGGIEEAARSAAARLPLALEGLGPEERGDFAAFAAGMRGRATVGEYAARRGRVAALEAELERRRVPEAREAAERLDEAGVEDPASLPPFVSGPGGARLVEALGELATLLNASAVIGAASEQAVQVIEALRLYARRDVEDFRTPVSLAESLDRVLTIFASRMRKEVEVVRDYLPSPRVRASPDKLARVWTNLVANALQAMDYRGKLVVRVGPARLERAAGGPAVEVSIEDSGPGIPDELKPRIFEPFFTTKPAGIGTGLGLEIARAVVLEHGGTIGFESRPGRTVFSVRLPAAEEEGAAG